MENGKDTIETIVRGFDPVNYVALVRYTAAIEQLL